MEMMLNLIEHHSVDVRCTFQIRHLRSDIHKFIRMFTQDYYQILRISPSASLSEIRKAYRLLALEFHPDKNSSQFASDYFVAIREAYAILSDPAQRKKYDLSRFPAQTVSRRIATTPTEIRLMSEELVKRIKTSNPDRINRDRLLQDLEAVLSVYHIQLLEKK